MTGAGGELPLDPDSDRVRVVDTAYEEYHHLLVSRLVRRGFGDDSQDIVNEAWTRALRSPTFDSAQDPVPYVWTIALRLAMKNQAAKVRESKELAGTAPLVEATVEDPQEAWCRAEEEAERSRRADRAMGALSARQRKILELDRLGTDTPQIARMLGITEATVYVHRHRALAKAQRIVRTGDGQEGE